MAERKTGLAQVSTSLLRPTTPHETIPPEETGPQEDRIEATDEGRAGEGARAASKTRKKRTPAGGEARGRKLTLPDAIHDRLWLLARQRRTTVSAVAADLLDRHLPKYRVEREA